MFPPIIPRGLRLSDQQSSVDKAGWLPATFQWYFFLLPIIASLSLGVATLALVLYSQRHHGLGADDGSSAILFGWRFTPTLLAVLYTQLTAILFEDAKRTEPFARLAKAPAHGATARGTVIQTSRAWWSVFLDALFKRKAIGKTSWCLVCAALINILALLVISPLSSALLTSEEVVISKAVEFHRIIPGDNAQMPLVTNRETCFRTMAALMRNISTSAWVSDSSVTLPFWPSSEHAQLGPDIISSPGTWKTETTTLSHSLSCEKMTLMGADMTQKWFSGAYDVLGHGPYNGTQPMVTFALVSDDGCRYEMTMHPIVGIAYNGGLAWSNTSTLNMWPDGVAFIGQIPFAPNITTTSPYARFNFTKECRDRDIILLSTPWTQPINISMGQSGNVPMNQTYERSPGFRMEGLLCESQYHMESRYVSASLSGTKQTVVTNTSSMSPGRESIPEALVNSSVFEASALRDNWREYFNTNAMLRDADRAAGGYLDPNVQPNRRTPATAFSGMGPLLGALYSFNISAMLADGNFAENAARVKGRLFTESLRDALMNSKAVQFEAVSGEMSTVEDRVVVIHEIGVTIAALFLVSLLLLTAVYWVSRLAYRPLNLRTDPSSTVGLSMLLHPRLASASTFNKLHQVPNTKLNSALRSETFYTTDGSLHESNTSSSSAGQSAEPCLT
jgi:hypothetical protein